MTLEQLCEAHGVKVTALLVGYVPDDDASKPREQRWPHFHWSVTVQCGGESYATTYRTDVGHVAPMPRGFMPNDSNSQREQAWRRHPRAPVKPSAADVLASLISDGQSASDTFEAFCSDLGYDTDSRKALETYLACQAAGSAVRRVLGKHYAAFCDAAGEH